MEKAHPLLKHSILEMTHISISETQPRGHGWPWERGPKTGASPVITPCGFSGRKWKEGGVLER